MRPSPSGVTWDWSVAAHAAVAVAPAAAFIAAGHVVHGLAAAVGIVLAGLTGFAATRRANVLGLVIAALFGVGLLIGSLLSSHNLLAIAGLFVVPLLAAVIAARQRFGTLLLNLIAPATAVGLSFNGVSEALPLIGVIIAGSLWSTLIGLVWPVRPVNVDRHRPPPVDVRYGLLIGGAAAAAVAFSTLFDFPHKGWAAAAALLVMRPDRDLLSVRGIGRVCATLGGAVLGYLLLSRTSPVWLYALLAAVLVVGAVATRSSRWYLAAVATTFLVLTMSLYGTVDPAANERIVENLAGVGLAYLFGMGVRNDRARAGATPAG